MPTVKSTKVSQVNYGKFRDIIHPITGKLTKVNFICIPTEDEFELMVRHACVRAEEVERQNKTKSKFQKKSMKISNVTTNSNQTIESPEKKEMISRATTLQKRQTDSISVPAKLTKFNSTNK